MCFDRRNCYIGHFKAFPSEHVAVKIQYAIAQHNFLILSLFMLNTCTTMPIIWHSKWLNQIIWGKLNQIITLTSSVITTFKTLSLFLLESLLHLKPASIIFWLIFNTHKIQSGTLLTDTSDHLPVFAIFKKFSIIQNDEFSYRSLNVSEERVNEIFSSVSWESVLSSFDVNHTYADFLKIFTSCFDQACPVFIKKTRKKAEKGWSTLVHEIWGSK